MSEGAEEQKEARHEDSVMMLLLRVSVVRVRWKPSWGADVGDAGQSWAKATSKKAEVGRGGGGRGRKKKVVGEVFEVSKGGGGENQEGQGGGSQLDRPKL